jgi:hypothetical protein
VTTTVETTTMVTTTMTTTMVAEESEDRKNCRSTSQKKGRMAASERMKDGRTDGRK